MNRLKCFSLYSVSVKVKGMYIIVGLGNPGEKYNGTRHNIGFDVITTLADKFNIKMDIGKYKALCGKGVINGEKVILVKPMTYMNLSGECLRQLVDYYKVDPSDIIIIFDDISLDVGQIRLRKKGSAGGHNGIKSIIQHLGTQEFYRIKVGVGDKPKEWDLADYVLGRFPENEKAKVNESINRSIEACETILENDIDYAMNIFNRKS